MEISDNTVSPYTETYRVLKRLVEDDALTNVEPIVWCEVGELSGTSKYGYRVTAQNLGNNWGEGQYLFFKTEGYARMEQMTVVAEATEPTYKAVTGDPESDAT